MKEHSQLDYVAESAKLLLLDFQKIKEEVHRVLCESVCLSVSSLSLSLKMCVCVYLCMCLGVSVKQCPYVEVVLSELVRQKILGW